MNETNSIVTYMIEVSANSDDCFTIAFTVIFLVLFTLSKHNLWGLLSGCRCLVPNTFSRSDFVLTLCSLVSLSLPPFL
jgi:hypothetical protein